jgi:hypothetical protein
VKYKEAWGQPKMRPKSSRKRFAALYQLAGVLVLWNDLTTGQKERLGILLLDALSEPERYSAKLIAELQRVALVP